MATKYASIQNLKFLLFEVHQVDQLSRHPHFQEYGKESVRMMIDGAKQLADAHLFPYYTEMDRLGVEFKEGKVMVHPQVLAYVRAAGEAGWIGATLGQDVGGLQMPMMVNSATKFLFEAANNCITGYPSLTAGSARVIESFGSQQLKDQYIPMMISGQWAGTMALTEAQAGSALAYITTSATPTEEGYYRIKGQKIFISGGDYEGMENIIHLMLARIDGAPAGTKGISLFVVPKKRRGENQELVSNNVSTAGIFHKMGQAAYVTTHLVMGEDDDCRGYLVGEPHQGLAYMFQMMNEARLGVGTAAAGTASAAYYASLEYAGERPQGRRLNEKDPTQPQTLIINHPDVRRMLLRQKAIVEGSLSLILQCSLYADLAAITDGQEKRKNELLLGLLTPLAKAYPTEMGIESISAGLQTLGGYGYCTDFPLEQYYRDVRIMSIYEGTTGIQSLDLLGRKVLMEDGAALKLFCQEVLETVERTNHLDELREIGKELKGTLDRLNQVSAYLIGLAEQGDPEVFLADATLYLEMFGQVAVAWQWLKNGLAAQNRMSEGGLSPQEQNFLESKIWTMRFFFTYELPRIEGLATSLTCDSRLTVKGDKEILT